MPRPSMLDGLHQKLLGNGLTALPVFAPQPVVVLVVFARRGVPGGNPASKVGSNAFAEKFTPLPSTVMAAPSRAPIRLGSCNCSAKLPLRSATHPTVASRGNRSTCELNW